MERNQSFKKINAPYEEWHMNKEKFDYKKAPPEGIFYNRMSASSHSRGHRYAPENTKNLLSWLEEKKKRYSIDISTLEAVSPLAVLARGYAIVSDEENNILRSSKELTVNQKIKARFKEGQVIAQVVEHVDET